MHAETIVQSPFAARFPDKGSRPHTAGCKAIPRTFYLVVNKGSMAIDTM